MNATGGYLKRAQRAPQLNEAVQRKQQLEQFKSAVQTNANSKTVIELTIPSNESIIQKLMPLGRFTFQSTLG